MPGVRARAGRRQKGIRILQPASNTVLPAAFKALLWATCPVFLSKPTRSKRVGRCGVAKQGEHGIAWTDVTWNPVRGCSRVSEGCRNCYAERQAARFCSPRDAIRPYTKLKPAGPFHGFVQITNGHPQWTGKVELVEKHLEDPLHWKTPKRIFVNSMSDLFHEALPDQAIDRVFAVMSQSPQHTFQILTKRPRRMLEWFSRSMVTDGVEESGITRFGWRHANTDGRWPLPNVWLGVSVEDQATADERIPLLLQTPGAVRFVSYEPALAAADFRRWVTVEKYPDARPDARIEFADQWKRLYPKLDWVIVGGESGPGARPFDIQWARNTIAQCRAAGVACFVKQLGSVPTECGERWRYEPKLKDRKGGDWDEWPVDLRVREFPPEAPAVRVAKLVPCIPDGLGFE